MIIIIIIIIILIIIKEMKEEEFLHFFLLKKDLNGERSVMEMIYIENTKKQTMKIYIVV